MLLSILISYVLVTLRSIAHQPDALIATTYMGLYIISDHTEFSHKQNTSFHFSGTLHFSCSSNYVKLAKPYLLCQN